MNNYSEVLKKLGISSKEFSIYKRLYELGPSTILELSNQTNTPRTTVHQNIESLVKKGLVSQIIQGSKRKLVAENPKKLNLLLDEKEFLAKEQLSEIHEIKNILPNIITEIADIEVLKQMPQTDVRFYEGINNLNRIYDDILAYPIVKTYVDSLAIKDALPDNVNKFLDAAMKDIEIWDLQVRNRQAIEFWSKYSYLKNYHFKFFPENIQIKSMDYLIYGESITIVQGGPKPSALIIKSKLLHENAETLYDLMWNLLP